MTGAEARLQSKVSEASQVLGHRDHGSQTGSRLRRRLEETREEGEGGRCRALGSNFERGGTRGSGNLASLRGRVGVCGWAAEGHGVPEVSRMRRFEEAYQRRELLAIGARCGGISLHHFGCRESRVQVADHKATSPRPPRARARSGARVRWQVWSRLSRDARLLPRAERRA